MQATTTRRRSRTTLLLATAILAPTLLAQAAAAQDAAASAAAPSTTDTASTNNAQPSGSAQPMPGDIIVTATKRSESIQKVPISMQALTPEVLEQHQVQSFDDYAKLLPSVSFQSFGPGQSQLFFRGITSGGDGLPGGSLPTSGVYLDEIPVTTIGALLDVHIYDVARVEALSGPQGTLYGASSLSGTLRIITNKPDPTKFSAGYDLQGNKFGNGGYGGTGEGFTNIPLGEKAAVRIVGFYERDGGFIDNKPGSRCYNRTNDMGGDTGTTCPGTAAPTDGSTTSPLTVNNSKFVKNNFNPNDTYGGRVALGINLDDNWTITPQLIAQHQHTKGSFLYDPKVGYLDVHDFTPEHTTDKWYQAALTIEGKISDWDVLYSGGYLQRSLDIVQDYSYYTVAYDSSPDYTYFTNQDGSALDPTQVFRNHQAITKQTHELRINSPADLPLRLTAGMFYQRQANHNVANYEIPGLAASQQGSGYAVSGDDVYLTNTHIVDRDYAMFAQVSYDILPHVTVTGGVRGFIAKNSISGFSGLLGDAEGAGCTMPNGAPGYGPGCQTINKTTNESGETHKLNVTWQVDPTHMLYATWSTGFRPGGNNRRGVPTSYAADTLDNYEAGWKTQWFDRHLTWNGAFYYEKWHKLQYGLPGFLAIVNVVNAGSARVLGVESDARLQFGGFSLTGSGAYNDGKLTSNFCNFNADSKPDCSLGVLAKKGTRLPIQPRFKGTLTARYDMPIGAVDAFVQGSVQHQSGTRSYLGDAQADALGNTPGFTTADFSVGGKYDNMTFELFVQNAFNKDGELSRNEECTLADCLSHYRIYPVKPQLFGVKFGQKF